MNIGLNIQENKLYKTGYCLSLFTIFYNVAEGLISVWFGFTDETLTLFGFGADSFIEVVSGLGILTMIWRIRQNPSSLKSSFEVTALRITGLCFYLLAVGLIIGAVLSIIFHKKPETTFWGILISFVSIAVMYWLTQAKISVGKRLNSAPIVADGRCTQVCVYMSVILLAASIIYYFTNFEYSDAIGSLGLAYFAFKEGKESFEKAKGIHNCSCSERNCG